MIGTGARLRCTFWLTYCKPILSRESNGIALPLLLQLERRDRLRWSISLVQFDQTCATADQAEGNDGLVGLVPIEGSKVWQTPIACHCVVGDICYTSPIDMV